MDYNVLVRGFVIGVSIAAPVGPIGILCTRRTLLHGRLNGLVSGLGAATADATYGFAAAFGLTFISNLLIQNQLWLRLVGGVFLCFLGIKTIVGKPAEKSFSENRRSLASAYVSTFALTITNPVTILSFAAAFASLGVGSTYGDYGSAILLALSVFSGSALWWIVLSSGVSLARRSVTLSLMKWINSVSGAILLGFGVFSLLSVVF